jgi:hypothetical protein
VLSLAGTNDASVAESRQRRALSAGEVAQTHLTLKRGASGKITFIDLNIPVPEAANVEFVQVAVPPVADRLDREMKLPQMPRPGNDELSPDRRLDLRQRDPDLERIAFLVEHGMK